MNSRMIRAGTRRALTGLLAGTALAWTHAACAQSAGPEGAAPAKAEAPASGLEDIVVTARRRAESLQSVPVAVTALSQAQLQNNIATDISKIAEIAPQVVVGTSGTGTGALITIRGISSSPTDAGLDQSVAVIIDGVPLSRGRIIQAALFDLKQVEVLEGPQALFFGKNSPAGAMSIQTAEPSANFEAYLTAGYEFQAKERSLEGAVSGPLSETLRARLAFRATRMDGWIKNLATPVADPFNPGVVAPGAIMGSTGPRGRDYAGRLTLAWSPDPDFDAVFRLTADSQRINGGDAYSEPFCIGTTTIPTELGVPLPNADCRKDRRKAVSGLAPEFAANFPYGNGGKPYLSSKLALASLTLTKRFDQVELVSTTGYYYQSLALANTGDASPFAQIYVAQRERQNLFTQELRADTKFDGPFNLMAGVYFEHARRPFTNYPDIFNAGVNPSTNDYTTAVTASQNRSESFSGFVQLRYDILPNLELSGGARYTRDVKRTSIANLANNPVAPFLGVNLYPEGSPLRSSFKGSNVSPEVTLTWHPQPSQTLYAAYKTGYKAGGISNPALLLATATTDNVRFDREKVQGFEAGYKADLFDRRLRLDLVAYRYKYSDLQVVTYNAATITFDIGNAAAARTQGVQGSIKWQVSPALTLDGGIGYNRARYLRYPNGQCYAGQTGAQGCVGGVQDLRGKALNRAPDVAFNVGGDYRMDIGSNLNADFSVRGSYTSSYQTAANYAPGGRQDAFWRLNAAVRLSTDGGRYEIALVGRNLTNSYYLVDTIGWSGSLDPNQYVGFFNRPREVMAQVRLKY